jgi:primosomal protein N'
VRLKDERAQSLKSPLFLVSKTPGFKSQHSKLKELRKLVLLNPCCTKARRAKISNLFKSNFVQEVMGLKTIL